jgi:hypothetical protein
MVNIRKLFSNDDLDVDAFLADPAIATIEPRPASENGTGELDPQYGDEEIYIRKRGDLLKIQALVVEGLPNEATINSKITEYLEAKLNDVSNEDPKAKKFRAKKDSASFIDLVPDQPTKAAFQKLKEYIDLVSGE